MVNSDGTNKHWNASDVKQIIDELGYIIPISSTIGDIIYTANIEGKIVINVTINVKDKQATYTIPEQLSVTRANNLVLAIDQKDLIQELETMKTNAKLIIDSVKTQKTILQKADKLLL